jgi:hypothetical protein
MRSVLLSPDPCQSARKGIGYKDGFNTGHADR